MMERAHLVSAIRLPNNLFTDNAGTEVGSDLVILQKDTRKEGLTEDERLFTRTGTLRGVSTNSYFIEHEEQIVCTSADLDTDPYGKPAMVYRHEGGAEGIADSLRGLLDRNLHARLAMRLYSGGIREARLKEEQVAKVRAAEPTLRTEDAGLAAASENTPRTEAARASAPTREEKPRNRASGNEPLRPVRLHGGGGAHCPDGRQAPPPEQPPQAGATPSAVAVRCTDANGGCNLQIFLCLFLEKLNMPQNTPVTKVS